MECMGQVFQESPVINKRKCLKTKKIMLPSLVALVYSLHLWYLTSMLVSIGTRQNKVPADLSHMTYSLVHSLVGIFTSRP